jgi:spore maturation protein CgeB
MISSTAPRRLRLVFLGLSLSSSWGNGHATTYRALLRGLAARGHDLLFLERETPWYAGNRDLPDPDFCRLALYDSLDDLERWRKEVDAVSRGSSGPAGGGAPRFVQRAARGVTAFYDIDTPVTLARLERGDREYLSREVIGGFDTYLSFTGGATLERLEREFGARRPHALYCSADTARYRPLDRPRRWDLGYLGTYSDDRQPTLERLLLEPARRLPHRRFVVAGPQYPETIDWPANVERIEHLPPEAHADFYSSLGFTLNVTRADMIRAGHSPSVRLFEAGACGCAIVSDVWPGLEELFEPGREILLAERGDTVVRLLEDDYEPLRARLAEAARRRVLEGHSGERRAAELEGWLASLLPASQLQGSSRTVDLEAAE